jgi:hypothetical protein
VAGIAALDRDAALARDAHAVDAQAALVDAATPERRRRASVPGLTVSPHSLSRGNVARSTMRTRAPAARQTMPGDAPAGPAPTIRTSGRGR